MGSLSQLVCRMVRIGAIFLILLVPSIAMAELPCELVKSTCVEGPATRNINGLDVYRDCWRYTDTYDCRGILALDSDCSILRTKGCGQVGSISCVQTASDGSCDIYASSYQCTTAPTTEELVMCGGNTFCTGGTCADTTYTANTAFTQSYGGLAALEEAAKDLNADSFMIFIGKALRCEKELFGLQDCCDMDGILNGILSCSAEEELLARERRDGRTIKIGTYCSDSVSVGIGSICVEETTTFCDFNSMLGRIVQEQGKPQLGLGFGTAKKPNCSGFTPEQFASLSFDAIDFSEFTNQFAVPPADIKGAMAELQQNIDSGAN